MNADELRRDDARARERAQSVFDRPFILEAGAGTGKTTTLVARILAWCLGPGWRLAEERFNAADAEKGLSDREVRERIAGDVHTRFAALTFTEAAAAEMSTRVGRGLADLVEGNPVQGLREDLLGLGAGERQTRARALVETLDRLAVSTIHAWCRRLLARYALECGWHPGFDVDADGRLEEAVLRERVDAALREAYREGVGSDLFELAVAGHGPAAIQEAVSGLVHAGVDGDRLSQPVFSPERVASVLEPMRELLEDLDRAIGPRLDEVGGGAKVTRDTRVAVSVGIDRIDTFAVEDLEAGSAAAMLEAWIEVFGEVFDETAIKRLAKWGKGGFNDTEKEAFGEQADTVAHAARAAAEALRGIVDCRPVAFERARRALVPLVAEVCEEMRAQGVASFDWLLIQARNLLRDRPDVRSRVRREIDQLLVDEFQDTSALQCEIVRFLALEGGAENRPSLFLVGDPKQSIYGWRQADLRAYDAFVAEVKAAGGEGALLTVNYRSVPGILEEVAKVIEPVMHEQEGMQPRFAPLVVAPRFEADDSGEAEAVVPVEYWLSWRRDPASGEFESGLYADPVVHLEAGFLAADLRRQHDECGAAWSDMAILLRGATSLDRILEALRIQGVPYAVERDRNYYRRREVIDAAGLVRAVIDPHDSVALVTLLRSSAVGVPDAAWLPLWRRNFPERWSVLHAARPEVLVELHSMVRDVAAEVASLEGEIDGLDRVRGWEANLGSLLETVAVLRQSYERDAADVFIERLRALTLFEVVESGRYLGSYRSANLERFFREFVAEWVQGADPQSILKRLRSDVSEGRDAEEAPPQGAGIDAVRIMTIHKAKGLDFEHVYVAQLSKESGSNQRDPVEVLGAPDALEFAFLEGTTLGLGRERNRATEVEQLERVRLLYVAMTRAKRRLVLVGAWPEQPSPPPARDAKSPMDLLQSRAGLPADLRGWMEGAEVGAAGLFRDGDGVRWVLPNPAGEGIGVLPEDRSELAPGMEGAEWLPMAERLRGERRDAERRMGRFFGASVTSGGRRQMSESRAAGVDEASGSNTVSPTAAAAAGVAVHRALEEFRFDEDPRAELQRQRERLPLWLSSLEHPDEREEAMARAEGVLDRFGAGPLFERFVALGPRVVARELDVWLPPGSSDDGVVAYRSGAVDLLCREPGGGWLVIDFKSDDVAGDAVSERSRQYDFQGRSYAAAVQEALGLDAPPRFELWFLAAGVVSEA
ncbi:MAG: UvrD-helicase domain-containing protein [Myxococcota bacterium]|nr:UvrD-helicase domain-containing protein [Myxococcota bacterium]